jgi:hypothetical protein
MMILVGSQRGGARQLAAHLLNDRENDHVTLHDLRGFVADDLRGALTEAQAIARGTRCRQCVFSLSLNPPKGVEVGIETFEAVADRAEQVLGLRGQPRAIVVHEKEGRRHAHVVWSRIDADKMTAINLPFFKSRLNALSKELYLEHGWDLPDGYRANGWKNPLNFTLAEWQQAKRIDADPREIKQIFQSAFARSDNLPSLRHALEEHGYFLARGDRRGVVAVDIHGEVFAVARWAGVKTKALTERLGEPDALPGVEEVRTDIKRRLTARVRGLLADDLLRQRDELRPLVAERRAMALEHRKERESLRHKQDARWQQESRDRAARFRRGLGTVLDVVTGRIFTIRRENEREAYLALERDRRQRETLILAQAREREDIQQRIETMRERQREERLRLARQIGLLLRADADGPDRGRRHTRNPTPTLSL